MWLAVPADCFLPVLHNVIVAKTYLWINATTRRINRVTLSRRRGRGQGMAGIRGNNHLQLHWHTRARFGRAVFQIFPTSSLTIFI